MDDRLRQADGPEYSIMKHILCGILLAILITGCDRKDEKAPLRVGMELTYPPFQMFKEMPPETEVKPDSLHKELDGSMWEIDGVWVKLSDALAKDLGRPLKIVPMTLRDLIPALQAGKIDLIVASMTITEPRKQLIDFSDPYARTGLGMLVGKDSAVNSLEDLRKAGHRIIVRPRTTGDYFAEKYLPGVPREQVQENAVCVRKVMDDPNAAFIYDQLSLWRDNRDLPHETRLLPDLLNEEMWGICIRKGDEKMRQRVNAFLARFRAEGGFDQLGEIYLKEETKFLAERKLPKLFP
jgi:polar amino acid transport system substrate-binding protein